MPSRKQQEQCALSTGADEELRAEITNMDLKATLFATVYTTPRRLSPDVIDKGATSVLRAADRNGQQVLPKRLFCRQCQTGTSSDSASPFVEEEMNQL
jgi:hypothetical protein